MSNLVHISDLVQAREMIQALNEKNAQLKTAKDKWELTFEAQTQADGGKFNLVVTARVGDRGAIHTVTQEELLSFRGDFETLSDSIAISLLTKLFEQQVKEDLRRAFIPKARNVEALAAKFGA